MKKLIILLCLFTLAFPAIAAEQKVFYNVSSVVDGDTVKVFIGDKTETIRLIGINSPESVDPRKPVECFGKEASRKAKEMLTGKKVYLETDDSQSARDKYGRMLAYVYLEDGTFFNKWMIRNGFAHEYTYGTAYKYQHDFKAEQDIAKKNKSGLWSPSTCAVQHTFYTSSFYSAKKYYCDTDPEWKKLSKKYLKSFKAEKDLLKKYPKRKLNNSCK